MLLAGLDRHGDLTHLFLADGTVTDTSLYDPFGVPLHVTGGFSPQVGFQGDWTDPDSGEVWMGARWYNPSSASFLSRDTVRGELSTPISLNRYSYGWANPLSYWDPDGRAVYPTAFGTGWQEDWVRRSDGSYTRHYERVEGGTNPVEGPKTDRNQGTAAAIRQTDAATRPASGQAVFSHLSSPTSMHRDWRLGLESMGRGLVDGLILEPLQTVFDLLYWSGTRKPPAGTVWNPNCRCTTAEAANPSPLFADYPLPLPPVGRPDITLGPVAGNRHEYAQGLLAAYGVGLAAAVSTLPTAAVRTLPTTTRATTLTDDLGRTAPRATSWVDDAAAPIGRRGSPIEIAPGTNSPATIGGRQYTGHALDRMQGRGIMPSAVDDAIAASRGIRGTDGSIIHYSPANNISVVLNADGSVRTVSYGVFKPR